MQQTIPSIRRLAEIRRDITEANVHEDQESVCRTLVLVSEQREEAPMATSSPLTIEELARLQHAEEVHDPKELVADIWESDEELDAFLADLRASRDVSIG